MIGADVFVIFVPLAAPQVQERQKKFVLLNFAIQP
jgi:hypothetical protein